MDGVLQGDQRLYSRAAWYGYYRQCWRLPQPDRPVRTARISGLLKKMGRGFVTELLGQGVNYVTGDYSRGAAGYWVEGGEIQHAVEEITIAFGNLRGMFLNIVDVGNDVVVRGSRQVGSILVAEMKIAGV